MTDHPTTASNPRCSGSPSCACPWHYPEGYKDDPPAASTRTEVQWKHVEAGDLVKLGHKPSIGELWFVVRRIVRFENKMILNVDGLWIDSITVHAYDYVSIGPRGSGSSQ